MINKNTHKTNIKIQMYQSLQALCISELSVWLKNYWKNIEYPPPKYVDPIPGQPTVKPFNFAATKYQPAKDSEVDYFVANFVANWFHYLADWFQMVKMHIRCQLIYLIFEICKLNN